MSSTLTLVLLGSVAFPAMLILIVILFNRMSSSRRTPKIFVGKTASSLSPLSDSASSSDHGASQANPGSFQAKGTPSPLTETSAQSTQNPSARSFVQRSRPFVSRDRANSNVDGMTSHEDEYKRGIQVTYDDELDIIIVVLNNVVMQTPADVTLMFQVLYNKVHPLLQARKKERGMFLTDICGLIIGKEAIAFWG